MEKIGKSKKRNGWNRCFAAFVPSASFVILTRMFSNLYFFLPIPTNSTSKIRVENGLMSAPVALEPYARS